MFSRLVLLFLGTLLAVGMSVPAQDLYVFYPTTTRPRVVQAKLAEACPALNITVFGRYRDFEARMKEAPPDAVLTRPELAGRFPDYRTVLQGVRMGRKREQFLLVSVDQPPDTSQIASGTIGVVDFLGRRGTESFVVESFNTSPRIKRVTKIEDLLPLLTFNMVGSVFVTNEHYSYLQRTSNLDFVALEIPGASGQLPALSVADDSDRELLLCVKNRKRFAAQLGVDGWEEPR